MANPTSNEIDEIESQLMARLREVYGKGRGSLPASWPNRFPAVYPRCEGWALRTHLAATAGELDDVRSPPSGIPTALTDCARPTPPSPTSNAHFAHVSWGVSPQGGLAFARFTEVVPSGPPIAPIVVALRRFLAKHWHLGLRELQPAFVG